MAEKEVVISGRMRMRRFWCESDDSDYEWAWSYLVGVWAEGLDVAEMYIVKGGSWNEVGWCCGMIGDH